MRRRVLTPVARRFRRRCGDREIPLCAAGVGMSDVAFVAVTIAIFVVLALIGKGAEKL